MEYLKLPYLLIAFRFLCAPVILWLTWQFGNEYRTAVLLLMYLGLISDILDGIIARNMGIASKNLRRLDSQTDMVFWISVAFSSYWMYPELILQQALPYYFIFITEFSCYLVSWVRFGKETSTHAWLSKLWGLSLLALFTSIIGFESARITYPLAFIIGVLSHLDRVLITLIIPEWTHDIPSTYHAYLLRTGKTFKKYRIFN